MTTKPSSSRRRFLATLGAGGAVAAVVAGGQQTAEIQLKTAFEAPQGKGYQLTEHVRNYYRSTKT
jgi:hypothetical protein